MPYGYNNQPILYRWHHEEQATEEQRKAFIQKKQPLIEKGNAQPYEYFFLLFRQERLLVQGKEVRDMIYALSWGLKPSEVGYFPVTLVHVGDGLTC